MTKRDDLRIVIELACFTMDRSDKEQLALLRVCDELDHDLNRESTTNTNYDYIAGQVIEPSHLYEMAQHTRQIEPFEKQKHVDLKKRKGKLKEAMR